MSWFFSGRRDTLVTLFGWATYIKFDIVPNSQENIFKVGAMIPFAAHRDSLFKTTCDGASYKRRH